MFTTISYSQKREGSIVVLQESIFDSLNRSKFELKDQVKEWAGKTFTDSRKVVTSETENAIVCRYHVVVRGSTGAPTAFEHTMTADFKDNKVRIKITADRSDLGYAAADFFYGPKPKKIYGKWMEELMQDSDAMIAGVHQALTVKEDW